MLWIILYCLVGAAVTFAYKYLTFKHKEPARYSWQQSDDNSTTIAIWSGILWPVVAPFSFAVVLAKYYAERKENAVEV